MLEKQNGGLLQLNNFIKIFFFYKNKLILINK